MRYEVIIFDADETLFDFKKSEKDAFEKAAIDLGLQYDENYHLKAYSQINAAIWKEFEKGLITQEKLKVERFRRFADQFNMTLNPYEFAKSYMKHLSYASFLYDDSLELVKDLSKDYRLIMITNGLKAVQENRIRRSAIAEYFEDIVISEEIQVSKPDPRIFEHALNAINYTNKNKVLMVGDSLSSDIQGGINFGIDTCWYNPHRLINQSIIQPRYEITSLSAIREVLEK